MHVQLVHLIQHVFGIIKHSGLRLRGSLPTVPFIMSSRFLGWATGLGRLALQCNDSPPGRSITVTTWDGFCLDVHVYSIHSCSWWRFTHCVSPFRLPTVRRAVSILPSVIIPVQFLVRVGWPVHVDNLLAARLAFLFVESAHNFPAIDEDSAFVLVRVWILRSRGCTPCWASFWLRS
ncbi:hypothetical protein R1flu_026641 [Riccia fluitans]|uniref:Uncharacterized protein n=1 Tax=Riccia fluitans TaxID=41844 RepID=A0ABD1XKK2_9MARC